MALDQALPGNPVVQELIDMGYDVGEEFTRFLATRSIRGRLEILRSMGVRSEPDYQIPPELE